MSDTKEMLPTLDMEVLREKVNQAAMKGALASIEEFYTGWNSPFRKEIDNHLKLQELSYSALCLPNIIGIINESLTNEIDLIANQAISKSFLPMVQRFLVRENKEINFSSILKEFIEATESKYDDSCEVTIKKSVHQWLDINISCEKRSYNMTFHLDYQSEKQGINKYQILRLPDYPDSFNRSNQTMKLCIDGATLEMPFTKDILKDPFTSYIARLIMGCSLITMDVNDFQDDMFTN